MKPLPFLTGMVLLSACAVISAAKSEVIEGRYKYEFGDTLQYNCGKTAPCTTVLVRDKFLQDHVNELDGKTIRVEVLRIDACHDKRSTSFACVTSGNGTAFVVVRWVNPIDQPASDPRR
jgi:hypothetical protein